MGSRVHKTFKFKRNLYYVQRYCYGIFHQKGFSAPEKYVVVAQDPGIAPAENAATIVAHYDQPKGVSRRACCSQHLAPEQRTVARSMGNMNESKKSLVTFLLTMNHDLCL